MFKPVMVTVAGFPGSVLIVMVPEPDVDAVTVSGEGDPDARIETVAEAE